MKLDPERHKRRSIRLAGYDYTRAGAYFVTAVTVKRECLFGEIVNGRMQLNRCGEIVQSEWLLTTQLRPYVVLDAWVVMPNHFHGIIFITDRGGTARRAPTKENLQSGTARPWGTARCAPTIEQFGKPVAGSVPTIMRAFKSAVTKQINDLRGTPGAAVWQRNYYEHVIRNEEALNKIRQYILNNSLKWEYDVENRSAESNAALLQKSRKAEQNFREELKWP